MISGMYLSLSLSLFQSTVRYLIIPTYSREKYFPSRNNRVAPPDGSRERDLGEEKPEDTRASLDTKGSIEGKKRANVDGNQEIIGREVKSSTSWRDPLNENALGRARTVD